MDILVCDFESYYSQTYSLSKITTEQYVRDPQFETIGVAVKKNDEKTVWFSGTDEETQDFLNQFDWANSLAIAHNAVFDMAILNWRYGIRPKRIADTLSMARALVGANTSVSLKSLAEYFGIGEKGTEVVNALGKRRADFTPEELRRYGHYCVNDVELTRTLFDALVDMGFPTDEFKLVDLTTRMFTEPVLELDATLLADHLRTVQATKEELLSKVLVDKSQLMSNPQFADLLRARGVEPPMKVSPTTGKETFAFSKSDEAFKELLEHEDFLVQALVAARLGVKSTLEETRTERFIGLAGRGSFPVPLRYYGAHTGRWSGEDKINLQNLPRGSLLKKAVLAPEGYVFLDSDSSQIECVPADTLVLTQRRGYVAIVDISLTDKLWDGVEWVRHEGVVFKGYKKVMSYGGISATYDHVVYTRDRGPLRLIDASLSGAELAVGERGGQPVRYVGGTPETHTPHEEAKSLRALPPLQQRVPCRAPRPTKREVPRVQRVRECQPLLRHATSGGVSYTTSTVQPDNVVYRSTRHQPRLPCIPGKGDTKQVSELRSLRPLRVGGAPAQRLQGGGDRADRQPWTLRAGEPPARDAGAERAEPGVQHHGGVPRGAYERSKVSPRSQADVPCRHSLQPAEEGAHGGDDLVPVFDIVNAGPRHRFTANGVVISNCRTLAWLAGQDDLVAAFNAGEDVYKIMATKIYNVALEDVTGEQRRVAKSAVLGCGYGLGWRKFKLYVKQTTGLTITDSDAEYIVQTYRETYPMIPIFWRKVDRALEAVADNERMRLGRDDLLLVDGSNGIVLPNDLRLKYPNMRRKQDEESGKTGLVYDTKKGRSTIPKHIWGGAGTENICQALARIVIGEQMIRVAKRYRVVLTVHDAIGSIAPEGEAQEALDFVQECMRVRPKWAPELPLDCEAGYGASYGDC